MISVYQVIDHRDGRRSPAGAFERAEFARVLRDEVSGVVGPEDFVLVLMDQIGDEWVASSAPIMRVDTFINNFGAQS